MRSSLLVALLFGSALVAACSVSSTPSVASGASASDPSSGDPVSADAASPADGGVGADGSKDVEPATACGDYAAALCHRMVDCPYLPLVYKDAVSCRTDQKALCEARSAATGSGFKGGVLTACTAALATASCWSVFAFRRVPGGFPDLAACRPTGTRPAAAGCGFDSECASGLCTADGYGSGCGKCADVKPVGGACTDGDGTQCFSNYCATDHCVAAPALGQACKGPSWSCAEGVCLALTCVAPRKEGESCQGSQYQQCEHGLSCASDHTCKKHYVSQLGESAQDGASRCAAGLYRDGYGPCKPRELKGASCAADDDCADGLLCLASKCAEPTAVAAACTP